VLLGSDVRERLLNVKRGLRELKTMLSEGPQVMPRPEAFELQQPVEVPKPKGRKKKAG